MLTSSNVPAVMLRSTASGVRFTPRNALAIADVFAAVRLLSETVATLPLHTFRRQGEERRRLPQSDPRLRGLFRGRSASCDRAHGGTEPVSAGPGRGRGHRPTALENRVDVAGQLAREPTPAVELRFELAAAKAAGVDFETAWSAALAAVKPDQVWRRVLSATRAEWAAAYLDQPAAGQAVAQSIDLAFAA